MTNHSTWLRSFLVFLFWIRQLVPVLLSYMSIVSEETNIKLRESICIILMKMYSCRSKTNFRRSESCCVTKKSNNRLITILSQIMLRKILSTYCISVQDPIYISSKVEYAILPVMRFPLFLLNSFHYFRYLEYLLKAEYAFNWYLYVHWYDTGANAIIFGIKCLFILEHELIIWCIYTESQYVLCLFCNSIDTFR